ncbi:MAG: YdcF family protein [Candidatus Micrarchaeota archaeon]|nr:YdcF family protein [Candidatus Micrarchaeota archaeon]
MPTFERGTNTDREQTENQTVSRITERIEAKAPIEIRKDEKKHYNAVVIFGDTDINGWTKERAIAASGYDADLYILVGTKREQDTMAKTLAANRINKDKIERTEPSRNTTQNIDRLHKHGYPNAFLSAIVVSHASHIDKRLKNPKLLGDAVDYHSIPETNDLSGTIRRLQHTALGKFYDGHSRNGPLSLLGRGLGVVREAFKSGVEKDND